MEELMSLSQEGIVEKYFDEFKVLLSRAKIFEEISEDYATYLFICGLKPKIGDILGLKLERAFSLARMRETILQGNSTQTNRYQTSGTNRASNFEVCTVVSLRDSGSTNDNGESIILQDFFQFTKIETAPKVFDEMPVGFDNKKDVGMGEDSKKKEIDDSKEKGKDISRTEKEICCLSQDFPIDCGSVVILPNFNRPGDQINVFHKVVNSRPGVTKLGCLFVSWDVLDKILEEVSNETFEVEQVLRGFKDIIRLDYKDKPKVFQIQMLIVLEHMWHRWKSKLMFLIVSKNWCSEPWKYDFKESNYKLKFKFWWAKSGLKNKKGHIWYKWKPKRLFSFKFVDGCNRNIELSWHYCNNKEQGVSRREDVGTIKQYICLSLLKNSASTLITTIAEKNLNLTIVNCCIGIQIYFTDVKRTSVMGVATIASLHPSLSMHGTITTALALGIYMTELPESNQLNVAFVDIGDADMQVYMEAHKKGHLKILANSLDYLIAPFDRKLPVIIAQASTAAHRLPLSTIAISSDGFIFVSGTKFIFMVEDVMEQLTGLVILHLGGNVLFGILQLFDRCMDELIKALPELSEDNSILELKEVVLSKSETKCQRLTFLGYSFTIAEELLPMVMSINWSVLNESKEVAENKVNDNNFCEAFVGRHRKRWWSKIVSAKEGRLSTTAVKLKKNCTFFSFFQLLIFEVKNFIGREYCYGNNSVGVNWELLNSIRVSSLMFVYLNDAGK
ncbi:putative Heat shock protein 70 family [Helianthus annuus]|nr:putative Heat shock protein 70 family [Helianthus annuus]KAJ0473201.1 putative Heat shock protein 70 family [Helianthus annuus]KAJ0652604.1 putative Heat shock protein 70 family [Helianthus annuus]KAJ0844872.1 putative Heat shock protein 70 family [Helianthus annuus]